MPKDINLLPQKKLGFLEKEQTIIFFRAVAILSILILISSFFGIIILGKNYSLDNIQKQQTDVRLQLSKVKNKINNQLILVDRIKRIQSILNTRVLLNGQISLIQKQIPPGIQIQSLQISKASFDMTISSPSLLNLKAFLDSLTTSVQKNSLIKKLTIQNVAVDTSTGLYTVSLEGVLK